MAIIVAREASTAATVMAWVLVLGATGSDWDWDMAWAMADMDSGLIIPIPPRIRLPRR